MQLFCHILKESELKGWPVEVDQRQGKEGTMIFLLLLPIFLLGQQVTAQEEEVIFDFGICPKSHPFAFQSGQQCCSKRSNWPDTNCEGDAIYCDSNSCEDHWSCCGPSCPLFRGALSETLEIENLSPDYDGRYRRTRHLEANRPIFEVFHGARQNDKCMWWRHFSRHWWIGLCDDIGDNAGFAYIDEDLSCPSECIPEVEFGDFVCPERSITWRRGGSNEVINGVTVTIDIDRYEGVSAAIESSDNTGAAGVNAVTQEVTRYKQSCRFVRRNGSFVCLKKNQ